MPSVQSQDLFDLQLRALPAATLPQTNADEGRNDSPPTWISGCPTTMADTCCYTSRYC